MKTQLSQPLQPHRVYMCYHRYTYSALLQWTMDTNSDPPNEKSSSPEYSMTAFSAQPISNIPGIMDTIPWEEGGGERRREDERGGERRRDEEGRGERNWQWCTGSIGVPYNNGRLLLCAWWPSSQVSPCSMRRVPQ